MKAIVERFERSGVLVIQAKVTLNTWLAGQLLRIKVQQYDQNFTLHFVHLLIGLQCFVAILRHILQ